MICSLPAHGEIVSAINIISKFLALDNFDPAMAKSQPFDCIVLAGNAVLHTAEEAFRLIQQGYSKKLLLSGGVGHSTRLLWQAVAAHDTYCAIEAEGRPEAHIFKDIAKKFFSLDSEAILVDDASTNCGENALFSRKVLEAAGSSMGTILIVQDPTMQRRTDASFRHVWRDNAGASISSWPTFIPCVVSENGCLVFTQPKRAGLWQMDRFISLLLGEIPRLRDDASGYGPNGKGFIGHVDIPPDVEAAYSLLKASTAGNLTERIF